MNYRKVTSIKIKKYYLNKDLFISYLIIYYYYFFFVNDKPRFILKENILIVNMSRFNSEIDDFFLRNHQFTWIILQLWYFEATLRTVNVILRLKTVMSIVGINYYSTNITWCFIAICDKWWKNTISRELYLSNIEQCVGWESVHSL